MIRLAASGKPALVASGVAALVSASGSGGSSSGFPTAVSLVDFQTSYSKAIPIVQRAAGQTVGNVPVLFTFVGPEPSTAQAQVTRGGAVIVPWTTLTNLNIGTASGQGILPGVPQGTGYLLHVRVPASSSTWLTSNGAQVWGVGVIFLMEGQSNMAQITSGGFNDYNVPGTSQAEFAYWNSGAIPGAFFDNAGWHGPSNGGSGPTGTDSAGDTLGDSLLLFLRLFAAALKSKYGVTVPVGIVPWAFDATGIAAFLAPAGQDYTNIFNNAGNTVGSIGFASPGNVYAGDFEGVLWHQGESDAGSTSPASYQTSLQSLYQTYLSYVSKFGRTAANLLFGVAVLGNYDVTAAPKIENIRLGEISFEAFAQGNGWPNAKLAMSCIDLWRGSSVGTNPPNNTLHMTASVVQRRAMRRFLQTVFKFTGCSGNGPSGEPFSGRGPQIMPTPARTGNVVTLSVQHEGGTALVVGNANTNAPAASGTPPTGFYVNTASDFSGTYIVPTIALVNSSTQIQLTFPGGTSYPVYVKYQGGKIGNTTVDGSGFTDSCYPNINNPIYDNTTYPLALGGLIASADQETLGLPLLPTNGAITVN